MKKILATAAILSFVFFQSHAQPWFQRAIGGSSTDQAESVRATADGGYIIAGYTLETSTAQMLLSKTDSAGNPLWSRAYGGSVGGFGNSVDVCDDGGFILTGWGKSFGAGDDEIYLVKTDSAGNIEWGKSFGGTTIDRGRCVIQTSDGGYAIAGHTNGFGAGSNDMMIIKTDSVGNSSWIKTYGTASGDNAWYIDETNDGGFVVTGNSNNGVGFINIPVLRLDANGDTLWTKFIGGTFPGITSGTYCKVLNNGDIALAGYTNVSGAGNEDGVVIRMDSLGNLVWAKTYGGSDDEKFNAFLETGSGNLIFTGYTESFGGGSFDRMYTVATNASGDTMWTKHTGSTNDDVAFGADRGHGGGIVTAGVTGGFGSGYQVYLVKTNGNSVCGGNGTLSQVGNPSFTITSGGYSVQSVSPTLTSPTFQNTLLTLGDSLICLDDPGPCLPPGISAINLVQDSICPGDTVSGAIAGNLNSANTWRFYADTCGGSHVYQHPSGSFSLTPTQSTWYYVRGVGGCVTPGACDSFFVHVTEIDNTVITVQIDSLYAAQNNASYQWLDCGNNFTPIPGATGQALTGFTVPEGQYAVEITLNGCVDTSDCYILQIELIEEEIFRNVSISPNPASDYILLKGLESWEGTELKLTTILGKEVYIDAEYGEMEIRLNTSTLQEGVYLLRLRKGDAVVTEKIVLKKY